MEAEGTSRDEREGRPRVRMLILRLFLDSEVRLEMLLLLWMLPPEDNDEDISSWDVKDAAMLLRARVLFLLVLMDNSLLLADKRRKVGLFFNSFRLLLVSGTDDVTLRR